MHAITNMPSTVRNGFKYAVLKANRPTTKVVTAPEII
jgi:hypothetical protein